MTIERTWKGYWAGWSQDEIETLAKELEKDRHRLRQKHSDVQAVQIGESVQRSSSFEELREIIDDLVQQIAEKVFEAIRKDYIDCTKNAEALHQLIKKLNEGKRVAAQDPSLKELNIRCANYTNKETCLMALGYISGRMGVSRDAPVEEWKREVEFWTQGGSSFFC